MKIIIETKNAAFDEHCPEEEVARILRILSRRIQRWGIPNKDEKWFVFDLNGNKTGFVEGSSK